MTNERNESVDSMTMPQVPGVVRGSDEAGSSREIVVVSVGGRLFGVVADEVDGVTEGLVPTPLPRAPKGVLGIVSVRGRMLTVLDPLVLVGERQDGETCSTQFVVSLRGDEQLALAAESKGRIIDVPEEEIEKIASSAIERVLLGVIQRGDETISLLDLKELFATATQTEDRRRNRD